MDGESWTVAAVTGVVVLVLRETVSGVISLIKTSADTSKDRRAEERLDMDRVTVLIKEERDRAVTRADRLEQRMDQVVREHDAKQEEIMDDLAATRLTLGRAIDRIRTMENMLSNAGQKILPWDPEQPSTSYRRPSSSEGGSEGEDQ